MIRFCFSQTNVCYSITLLKFVSDFLLVDTEELRSLRYLYGYSLVTRENLVRHLSVLEEFPFLIDAIMTTCNGGTYHHSILFCLLPHYFSSITGPVITFHTYSLPSLIPIALHSDALISMLSKITYGTPTDLSLCMSCISSSHHHHLNILQ